MNAGAPPPTPPSPVRMLAAQLLAPLFGGLVARTILVLLVSMGLVHVASLVAYQVALDREATLGSETRIADRLVTIKRAVARTAPAEREAVAHDLSGGPIEAHWSRTEHAVAGGAPSDAWDTLRRRLREFAPEVEEDGIVIGASRRDAADPHLMLVSMRLPDASWVNVTLAAWTAAPATGHGIVHSTSLMALGVVAVAVLLVRWLTRPLTIVATAARTAYRGREAVRVPETGPREVREVAVAFNDMQARIKRLIDDRTDALAAVSHDLRTPLTRLRLRLEDGVAPATRRAAEADLDEMERMIDATLSYLRGAGDGEEARPLDLAAVLQTVVADAADAGGRASFEGPPSLVIRARRLALKRALGNVVGNAVKYGGTARVTLRSSTEGGRKQAVVEVDDDGPGVPEDGLERAFEPFVRLESSRDATTGGFGLGLAIARAVVRDHRGDVVLRNRPGGGLRATITLPILDDAV